MSRLTFRTFVLAVALLVPAAAVAASQATISQASKAEYSVNFGVRQGALVLVGDVLLFVDSENPAASFALSRDQVASINSSADLMTVTAKQPVQAGDASRTQLAFKLAMPTQAQAYIAWASGAASVATAAAAPGAASEGVKAVVEQEPIAFDVTHVHFPFGSCQGKMVISKDRFAFESVSNVEHSRRMEMKDIREAKRSNPYQLEVRPFVGNDLEFKISGNGMSSTEYRTLVDFITNARMNKQ